MMRLLICMLAFLPWIAAADEAGLPMELLGKSWFVGQPIDAVVNLPFKEEPDFEWPEEGADFQLVDVVVDQAGDSSPDGHIARIRWVPRRTGMLTLPSVSFSAGGKVVESPSRQLSVSEPRETDEMSLSIRPALEEVYVGQPLRVDVTWKSGLRLGALRGLRLHPSFFNDPSIEVVVPRPTVPEDEQMGLPVGGRRVIAHSEPTAGRAASAEREVGEVRFSLYLRFSDPGLKTLEGAKLECARVLEKWSDFTNYASYFNNSLFELPGDRVRYERIYCVSDRSEINVLPLPEEGRLESFSGLFTPIRIESSVEPPSGEVGQVMSLGLRLYSDVDGTLLEIPELTRQRGFQNHFWVSPDTAARWHADGREFVTRFRPLTTSVRAVPALDIQVFDPELGRYEILSTDPIPLTICEGESGSHFDVRSIPGAANELLTNPDGVWQNERSEFMNELIDATVRMFSGGFWVWLFLGPAMFFALRSRVLEWRRRAEDPAHSRRVAAFQQFRKRPELDTFRIFVAELLCLDPKALTGAEVTSALQGAKCEAALVDEVASVFEEDDQQRYDSGAVGKRSPRDWVGLARNVQRQLMWVLLLLVTAAGLQRVEGDQWSEAESLFSHAMEIPVGEDSKPHFAAAALAFEDCADAGRLVGLAWVNAGNAWFKSGEIGRAIAAYRKAESHRPFDRKLDDNLAAARALCVDEVERSGSSGWLRWPLPVPLRWQIAALAFGWCLLWLVLLLRLRYPIRLLRVSGVTLWALLGLLSASVVTARLMDREEGVVVASEVMGRKGPGYGYEPAFQGVMHQGLEFNRGERRGTWVELILPDGRSAWVQADAVELIPN